MCDIDQIFQTSPSANILLRKLTCFSRQYRDKTTFTANELLRKMEAHIDGLFQEYDFILMGQKIGIVVIEFNCSQLDFSSHQKCLPQSYFLKIQNLNTVDDMFLNRNVDEGCGMKWMTCL